MLVNADKPEVRQRLDQLASQMDFGNSLVEVICKYPEPFTLLPETTGFDFLAMTQVDGRPNRAVFKLFEIEDGPMKNSHAVFFYKKSQLPFSHDRFSYGTCIASLQGSPNDTQLEWLGYAASGFDPKSAPRTLRRAFTFTVPD